MTRNSDRTDKNLLVNHAYHTDAQLNIRYQTHERYTVPARDFPGWVLDRIDWRGDEWVLDLGSGPGMYFGPVRARIPDGRHFAGDLSFGMVQRAAQNTDATPGTLANFDAEHLPFADDRFDVVLANHMLYHVPDLPAAVEEIRRVLKPEGVLIAATNSTTNMPELDTLYRRALLILTNFQYQDDFWGEESPVENFSLENGARLLGRQFFAVARYDLPSALVFPEAEPVVAYIDSMRDLRESSLPEGVTWEAYMDVVQQQLTRLISNSGEFRVKKLAGVLVATDRGSFASAYHEAQSDTA